VTTYHWLLFLHLLLAFALVGAEVLFSFLIVSLWRRDLPSDIARVSDVSRLGSVQPCRLSGLPGSPPPRLGRHARWRGLDLLEGKVERPQRSVVARDRLPGRGSRLSAPRRHDRPRRHRSAAAPSDGRADELYGRIAKPLATIMLVGYRVAVWAMTTKPN